MSGKARATAVVSMTVEIERSAWGGNCQVDQVWDQARREAEEQIRAVLVKHNIAARISDVKVNAIIMPDGAP